MPAAMAQELGRRGWPEAVRPRVRTAPAREAVRLLAGRLPGARWLTRHEAGWCSVDAVFNGLDRAVASRVPALLHGREAISGRVRLRGRRGSHVPGGTSARSDVRLRSAHRLLDGERGNLRRGSRARTRMGTHADRPARQRRQARAQNRRTRNGRYRGGRQFLHAPDVGIVAVVARERACHSLRCADARNRSRVHGVRGQRFAPFACAVRRVARTAQGIVLSARRGEPPERPRRTDATRRKNGSRLRSAGSRRARPPLDSLAAARGPARGNVAAGCIGAAIVVRGVWPGAARSHVAWPARDRHRAHRRAGRDRRWRGRIHRGRSARRKPSPKNSNSCGANLPASPP